MTRSFRRAGAHVRMELEPVEADLLRSLQASLRELLHSRDTTEPVVQRLFPRAVEGDETEDEQVRALLHDDLLADRLAGLDLLVGLLDRGAHHKGLLRVDLTPDETGIVLRVLNDLRLALGASVGVEHLDRELLGEDDPRAQRVAAMDHLGWLQEQLLGVLDPESLRYADDLDD